MIALQREVDSLVFGSWRDAAANSVRKPLLLPDTFAESTAERSAAENEIAQDQRSVGRVSVAERVLLAAIKQSIRFTGGWDRIERTIYLWMRVSVDADVWLGCFPVGQLRPSAAF